jgi:hypothetical protein
VPGAKEAIRLSVWFVFVATGLSAIAALITLAAGQPSRDALASAVMFALIGMGLLRNSRAAAVLGAVLIGIGFIATLASGGVPGVVGVLTFVALLSGVRGTFAYRRLSRPNEVETT